MTHDMTTQPITGHWMLNKWGWTLWIHSVWFKQKK